MFPDYKNPEEWEKQCECLAWTCFCCPGTVAPTSMASPLTFKHKNNENKPAGGLKGAIPRRLGAIFALMFSHIDLTPTDCIVAFSLAMKRQEIRRRALFAAMSRDARDAGADGNGGISSNGGGGGISGSGRREFAKERESIGNKTMGGISRAASAVRGFRSKNRSTSTTDKANGTAVDGDTNGAVNSSGGNGGDAARSPESIDGLLSGLEAGKGLASDGIDVDVGVDNIINRNNGEMMQPLEEEIEFHPQFAHSDDANDLGRSSSVASDAAMRRKRSVDPVALGSATAVAQDEDEIAQAALEDDLVIDDEEAAIGITRPLSMTPADAETLQEAAYYMKYAFAAYGWMLFVYSKKTTGLFKLCCGRGCGLLSSIVTRKHGVIPFANPLQAPYFNNEAILQATEIAHEEDLVDVRLEAEVPNVLPYYIAVDHVKKAVVLAFRGSLSMEDVIRDLLFEPADVDLWVEEKRISGWDAPLPDLKPATETTKYAAHSGIFEAARATLADIQSTGVLAGLLLGPEKKLPEYKLVVCGHSLGEKSLPF